MAQDSIQLQEKYQHYFYKNLQEKFGKEPFLYQIVPFKNYTKATFSLERENNEIKDAQTPKGKTDIQLRAEGIYREGKTLFTGSIGYNKNYHTSSGYNLTQMYPYKNTAEKSPFYTLSYNQGDWNNQFYTINGNVLFPIIHNKLFISIGAQYNTLQFFRTVQPKPRLRNLDASGKISLYYKLSKSYIGIHGFGGFFNNLSDIIYDGDSDYFNIPNNVDLYLRTSFGLGSIETALSSVNEEKENKRGFGLSFSQYNKEVLFNAKAMLTSSKNSFFNVFGDDEVLVGTYSVTKVSGELGTANFKKGRSLTAKGSYTFGENFKVSTNGKNYESTLLKGAVEYQIIKENTNNIAYNYGIRGSLYKLTQKDFQVVNSINYTNIGISAFYGKDFKTNKTQKVYVLGEVGGVFNLNKNSVFSQTNLFINEVTTPNFLLSTASKANILLNIGHQKKLNNGLYLDIGVKYNANYFFNLPNNQFSNEPINQYSQIYLSLIY